MRRRTVLLPVLLTFLVGAEPALAWTWPADGPVQQPFTYVGDPYGGGQHRGIDIDAAPGSHVVAPHAGVVTFAGAVPGSGRTLTISTADGYAITLLHLGSLLVARGDTVEEGDAVGLASSSGGSQPETGLHLGVRLASDPAGYLDPLGLLPARAGALVSETPSSADEPSPAGREEATVESVVEPTASVDPPDPAEPEGLHEAQISAMVPQHEAAATTVEEHAAPAVESPVAPPSEPTASSLPEAASSPAVVEPSQPVETVEPHGLPTAAAEDFRPSKRRANMPVAVLTWLPDGERDAGTSRRQRTRAGQRTRVGPEPSEMRRAPLVPEMRIVRHDRVGLLGRPVRSGESAEGSRTRSTWIAGEILVLLGLIATLGGAVVLLAQRRAKALGSVAWSVAAAHCLEPGGISRGEPVVVLRPSSQITPGPRLGRSPLHSGAKRPSGPRDGERRRHSVPLDRSATGSSRARHRSLSERGARNRDRASV